MSASKFNVEPNGGIFDVSPKNDLASPNVKTTNTVFSLTLSCSTHCDVNLRASRPVTSRASLDVKHELLDVRLRVMRDVKPRG